MKVLLSLFDYSGAWGQPFADAGWQVIPWDIKLDELMDINLIDSAETALDLFPQVDAIIAGVPCTDFAGSGARHWKAKDADGRTAASVALVHQVMRLVDLYAPTDPDYEGPWFWCVENPVGRINKLVPELGKPWYFQPCDYAQYLNMPRDVMERLYAIRMKHGKGVTNAEANLVMQWEQYTKRTGLWGDFNRNLEKREKLPIKVCNQGSPIQRYGGKSARTKELRSITPSGFAEAFFRANKDFQGRAHLPAPEPLNYPHPQLKLF